MATRLTRRLLGILALAILPCATSSAQVPAGPEYRVNTYTPLTQTNGRVAMNQSGDFVVVWTSFDSVARIVGQRFSRNGTPQGAEFTVNETVAGIHTEGDVAVDDRGNFIVVWAREAVQFQGEILGRRFNASGVPRGSEFQINNYTTGQQRGPRVAADSRGSFVVAWSSDGQDGSGGGVFGRRFDSSGAPLSAEFRINSHTTGYQGQPSLDIDGSHNFVVVWSSRYQTGDDEFGIFGQRFTASGTPQGPEFHVNTYTTSRQAGGVVATDRDGNFVVAWESYQYFQPASEVFAQRYNAVGMTVGLEFRVNAYTTGWQREPSVDSDDTGNFVASWSSLSNQDGSISGVFAQRYDSSGSPRGAEFRVNSYTTDAQILPEVAADPAGNFVVAWSSLGQDGESWGVFGQRFGGLLPSALAADTFASPTSDGNRVFEAGETVAVVPTWRNVNGAAQTFNGIASAFTGPGAPGDPTYTIADASASYGTVANGATASCAGVADCYTVGTSVPTARPLTHWDATLREDILPAAQGQSKAWAMHVGDSFADVPRVSAFYRFVETLLHRGVTAGCGQTLYCPGNPTAREQMAVFVLVAREGAGYLPSPCGATPLFGDVPATSPFCRWIEELARRGVVGGCGGGNYCPTADVSREQMAVFVLRTVDPALSPAPCAPPNIYNDVPESSPFCRWIEELTSRGVVTGCGAGNYCPTAPVSREQVGVFITVTFGLALYGP